MAARRRNKVVDELVIDDLDLDSIPDVIDHDSGITEDEVEVEAQARKYMSHENCDHPRQGEAGKAARAACRRAVRAWLKAEEEYLTSAV